MSLARVPLYGQPQRSVTVDPEATKGAVFGVNLTYPDGSLVKASDFQGATTPSTPGNTVVVWQLILDVPPNVQALASIGTTGLYTITGPGASATRAIEGDGETTIVLDGDGVAGNPVIKALNPYVTYLVDENGNYLVDENGDLIVSGDPNPQFDAQGSAAAALSAANAYTDDVVPSEVLYCDAINGRVGVGTTSPTFQFHVEGSTAGLYLNRTGGSESFIALAMGGTTQGQLRADTSGYLKVTNALGSTELIRLGADLGVIGGRLFGTALHNNAGGITGTTNQYVGSGTYTPTLTNTANIDASTSQVFQYQRVGNVVTVSGTVNIDPTAATTLTTMGISLPIASDLNSYVQCCGTAVSRVAGVSGDIQGDTTNDRATLNFTNGASTANSAWFLTFTYLVR